MARGRTPAQLRQNEFSSKTLEGLSSAAEILGLTAEKNGALSPLGRRFALADGELARELAGEVVRSFAPYEQVLDAARAWGDVTHLEWVQAWWADRGLGSSESNRIEAAPVFARFVEAAGFGRYVQGRKGRQSRIVWDGASELEGDERGRHEAEPVITDAIDIPTPKHESNGHRHVASRPPHDPPNRVSWELSPGRRLELSLPADLSPEERVRVASLLSLLLGRD